MIKIDNIPIQDYATPYSRSCYGENYNQFFGKTIIVKEKIMSEEEIIKEFNSLINNARANWVVDDYETLQKMLDLYNKEKEKNKKLKRALARTDKYYEIKKNY